MRTVAGGVFGTVTVPSTTYGSSADDDSFDSPKQYRPR